MRETLRHRGFAHLFGSSLVTQIGTKIQRIALLVLVYSLTKEAMWVSLVVATQLVAMVGIGPVLSAWADTQERRRMLVVTEFLRAPLVFLIPVVGGISLVGLLALVLAAEILRSLHDPVANAVVPDLVPEDRVDAANALMYFTQSFAEIVFVGLAGVLVAVVGPKPAFWVDAFTYLVSSLILLGLPTLEPGDATDDGYWNRVREGLDHIVGHTVVRRTVGTLFAAALFGSVEGVLGVVLAVAVLQVGSAGFGLMEAVMALGSVIGIVLVPRLTTRIPRERLFLLSLFAFGLFEASVGAFPNYTWVLIAFLISGALNMGFIIPVRSILQLNTPPEMRTRTFAAFGAATNGAALIGTFLAGALEKPLGSPLVFFLAGLGVTAMTLTVLLRGGIPPATSDPTASSVT